MAYEDTNKSYIELLIENRNWKAAYSALLAYIDYNGEDCWSKSFMALVESHLKAGD